MARFIGLAVAAVLSAGTPAAGQDTDEVKRLKARIELLEAKLEVATLKVEKLEAENQRLLKAAGKAPAGDKPAADKPKHTDRFNGGTEEAEYVLEKVTRSGREVTLELTATLTKGPERRTLHYFSVNVVDADGKSHSGRVNANAGGRAMPEKADLRAGVGTKVQIRFPLAQDVTRLKTLEVTSSAVERVAIRFSDVEVPK